MEVKGKCSGAPVSFHIQEAEAGRVSELEASRVYIMTSRLAKATWSRRCFKTRKKKRHRYRSFQRSGKLEGPH